MAKKPQFVDLNQLEENNRIEMIGQTAYVQKPDGEYPIIVFIVDLEGEDGFKKADRYIKKLLAKFPDLEVQMKSKDMMPHVVVVKIQRVKNLKSN